MNENKPSISDDDSRPPFRWTRTLLLLTASGGLGFVVAHYRQPQLPIFVQAIVGCIFGVIAVGSMIRIF